MSGKTDSVNAALLFRIPIWAVAGWDMQHSDTVVTMDLFQRSMTVNLKKGPVLVTTKQLWLDLWQFFLRAAYGAVRQFFTFILWI